MGVLVLRVVAQESQQMTALPGPNGVVRFGPRYLLIRVLPTHSSGLFVVLRGAGDVIKPAANSGHFLAVTGRASLPRHLARSAST